MDKLKKMTDDKEVDKEDRNFLGLAVYYHIHPGFLQDRIPFEEDDKKEHHFSVRACAAGYI